MGPGRAELEPWIDRLRGRFVVFDGPDGSGKSTQVHRFARHVEAAGLEVCQVREPGGTTIGERVREILLAPEHAEMDVRCEMMLYMASRAQLVAERIAPAQAAGQMVLADRFISSTLAYQGTAGGLAMEDIRAAGRIAVGEHWPDLCVIFDVDEQTAAARLSPLLDRMERKGIAYHRRVRAGYLDQARTEPGRHLVVDASGDPDAVFGRLIAALRERMMGEVG